jgi:hypothetical protein
VLPLIMSGIAVAGLLTLMIPTAAWRAVPAGPADGAGPQAPSAW